MDGLSALSVTATVAQFIQFGCSLVSKSKEIYQSANGEPVQQVAAVTAARRLAELSERIKVSRRVEGRGIEDGSADEQALEAICEGCISVSKELISKLEKLKIEDVRKHRVFKSFRQALKSVWSKEAVDEVAQRLKGFQTELDAHLLVSLSEKFNNLKILHDKTFGSLDQQLKQSIKTSLPYLIDIHMKMKELAELQQKALDLDQRKGFINEHKDELAKAATEREELYQSADALILQELWFPEISYRHIEIEKAHKQTFAWVLKHNLANLLCAKPGGEARMWHNFAKWLKESGNLYWINGKAGSGKSTLMRYICDSEITRGYLRSWAGALELQITSFYFWKSGSKEQRSQTGLLRSLLYEILKGHRGLIRVLFEEEWDCFVSSRSRSNVPWRSWSFPQLERAFYEAIHLTRDGTKSCIFIDGLDEFEGDPEPLVILLKKIAEFQNVKVCLSSRPWIIFEEHLEGYPGLRLQDLTYDDIRLYVRDRLEESSKMQHLAKSKQALALTHSIVTKANGVFLWVRLVVWSLLIGLRNRDDISELQKRLDHLPSDLDALYRHMLQRIDPLYIAQACRVFQIFNAFSDLHIQPTVLELDLAVTATYADVMNPLAVVMSDQEISQRCDRMSAHLQTRCEGLLEVHDIRDRHWEGIENPRWDFPQENLRNDEDNSRSDLHRRVKADLKVAYLHRTVREFLTVESVRQILLDHTGSTTQFEPHISLLMGYIINLKGDICSFYCASQISDEQLTWTVVSEALHIAQKVKCSSMWLRDSLLEEFSNAALRFAHFPPSVASRKNIYTSLTLPEWHAAFLSATVIFGLTSFVENTLMSNSNMHQGADGASILALALRFPIILPALGRKHNPIRDTNQPIFPSMVNLLLRYGADPNEIDYKCTGTLSMWQVAVYSYLIALSLPGCKESQQEGAWADIVKSMLEYGGNREVKCNRCHPREWVKGWGRKYKQWEFDIICSADGRPLLPLINDLLVKKGHRPLYSSGSASVSSTGDILDGYV